MKKKCEFYLSHNFWNINPTSQELLTSVLGIKEHSPAELVKARITEKIPWLGSPELCVKQFYKGERWGVFVGFFCCSCF